MRHDHMGDFIFLAVYYPIFSILKSIFYLWIAVKSFDSMGLHTIPNPEPFPIKTHIQRKYQNRSNVQGAWSRTSPANQGTLTELVCKVPSNHLGTLSQEQAIGGWERSMVQGVIHSSNFNLYTLLQKIFFDPPSCTHKVSKLRSGIAINDSCGLDVPDFVRQLPNSLINFHGTLRYPKPQPTKQSNEWLRFKSN